MRHISREYVFEEQDYGLEPKVAEQYREEIKAKEERIAELVEEWETAPDGPDRRSIRTAASREANKLREEVKELKEALKGSPPGPIAGEVHVKRFLLKLHGYVTGYDEAKEEFAERFSVNPESALEWRGKDVVSNEFYARMAKVIIRRYANWLTTGLIRKGWSHREDDDEYDEAPGREMDGHTRVLRLAEFTFDSYDHVVDELVRTPVPSWSSSHWATAVEYTKQEAKGTWAQELAYILADMKYALKTAAVYEDLASEGR